MSIFPKTIDELVEKVQDSYATFDPQVNKFTWITLQHVMLEILKVKGGNNYKIPHIYWEIKIGKDGNVAN